MPTPQAATADPTALIVPPSSSRMNAGSSGWRIAAANMASPDVMATPRTRALAATWRSPSPSAWTPLVGPSSEATRGDRDPRQHDRREEKVAALTAKATSTSACLAISAPTSGPASTARWKVADSVALAVNSSRPATRLGSEAYSAGWNSAPKAPRHAATARM